MKHLSFFGHLPGLVLVCILLLALEACKPDPEPKPDPCATYKRISAEFDMFEEVYYGKANIPVIDTIRLNLFCIPRQRFKEYYWKIGNEAEYRRDSILIVDFGGRNWGEVSITFIGKYPIMPSCSINQPEADTVVKYVYPIAAREVPPIVGTYEGSNEGIPAIRYSIKIEYIPTSDKYKILNIANGCPSYENFRVGAKGFKLYDRGSEINCHVGGGIGYLTRNDSLYLNYVRVDSVRENSLGKYISYLSNHRFCAKRVNR
jgi:hypothetical protein